MDGFRAPRVDEHGDEFLHTEVRRACRFEDVVEVSFDDATYATLPAEPLGFRAALDTSHLRVRDACAVAADFATVFAAAG